MGAVVHWFRRDFRVRDNTGLYSAAAEGEGVVGVFVVDPRWWMEKEGKLGAFQAKFWLESLKELKEGLGKLGIPLVVRTDRDPVKAVLEVVKETGARAVTYNKEYEPAQIAMDDRLEREGRAMGVEVKAYKDAAVFEEQEILTGGNTVYSVFSPYKRAYLKAVEADRGVIEARGLPGKSKREVRVGSEEIPTLRALGFGEVELDVKPGERAGMHMLEEFCGGPGIERYRDLRDYPAEMLKGRGISRLSAHLNAGTVSMRQALSAAFEAISRLSGKKPVGKTADGGELHSPRDSGEHFISELIWREFYRMILYNFPETVNRPFQEGVSYVTWADDPAMIRAWSEGKTGYPIVDAGMRQVRATGFMHNRLRMVTAMFLTKDLDCHWITGERLFMKWLMDYDQACNVGGWQWSASTGTDAAPYFRVMNPILQGQRFDGAGEFVKRYVPELARVPAKFVQSPWEMPVAMQKEVGCMVGRDYPERVVDHAEAKERAIGKFRR